MRDNRLRYTAMACFVLAGLLAALSPAHAGEVLIKSGSVMVPWFGPSDEVNTTAGNGKIGDSFAIPATYVGKHFRMQYPRMNDLVVPEAAGFKLYAVDLDVYFYNAEGWNQDGTIRKWDNETGVNPGPESGIIPPGTDRAFVVISTLSPSALDVSFDFFGTL